MGNSQSSDEPKSPSAGTPQQSSRRERGRDSPTSRLVPNGNQNVPTRKTPHSHVTKTQTPPTALAPSSSTASTSTSTAHAQATVSASPSSSSHSRARSITTGTPKSGTEDSAVSSHRSSPMGNQESRHRPPSRSSTLPPPVADKPAASPLSQPVNVPQPSHNDVLNEKETFTPPFSPPSYVLPGNDFSRPPRLPLPIERDPEPTSPIVTPLDADTPAEQNEDELARRSSMLSATTLDEDEVADIETFALESDPYAQKVLTTLEFRGEGKTVFVTGTFAKWEKKFRMQKTQDKDGKPVYTLTAPLPAGTHHIKFLVDGDMVISNQYPTTVDFTNSLVNYFEVAAPMPSTTETQLPAPTEPMPIPGASVPGATTETGQSAARPLDIRTRSPETENELASRNQESSAPGPGFPDQQPSQGISIPGQESHQDGHWQQQPQPKPKQRLPRPKYTNEIPEVLLHLDLYNNPEDERYRRASKAIHHLPQPPSLPMFMSKSILNATTPHKDDASVLTMPNHTVLNHLATSSIRNGVLATSGTTRYKRKFLTTIMYKPTSDDG